VLPNIAQRGVLAVTLPLEARTCIAEYFLKREFCGEKTS
jgi:hypothetical protein